MKNKKFFNKSVEKRCEYCLHAKLFEGSGDTLCKYKGVVDPYYKCRRYKYDILKRKPHVVRADTDFSADDFII